LYGDLHRSPTKYNSLLHRYADKVAVKCHIRVFFFILNLTLTALKTTKKLVKKYSAH
jgi:hypothetical protein